ncbi:MAG: class I SAM-dependent methyltransferase [Actinomycetota bacterium]|nr:class I SAM-dependent methyltransferase [Actinomycetota bacterium]
MSTDGTASYGGITNLPPRVAAAVEQARALRFENSSRPAHGRLLATLAGGVGDGAIGETGTGCGVGLAWMTTAAAPGARLISVEAHARRAEAAREVLGDDPRVTILTGDWSELAGHGPFDLLVLDGGGKRGEPKADPEAWLRRGGVLVLDDFTPSTEWPRRYAGAVDETRMHWLTHPSLLAAEIRTDPDAVCVLAVRR